MVYTYDGDHIFGNKYFPNMINEVTTMMHELTSLLEKETIARQLSTVNTKDGIAGVNISKTKVSALDNDVLSARQHAHGKFDEERAKLVLESENICEEYRRWAEWDFKTNVDKAENLYNKEKSTGVELTMIQYIQDVMQINPDIKVENIKKYVIEQYYDISDDPEVIKRMLKLRLNYNKKMLSIYQKMLQLNYKVLELSSEQAQKVSDQLNIEDIREIISMHKDKFIKNGGKFYDLRELGFGVGYIMDGEFTRLEQFTTFEHWLNWMVRYDAVVFSHGGYNNKSVMNLLDPSFRKDLKVFTDFCNLVNKHSTLLMGIQPVREWSEEDRKEFEKLSKIVSQKYKIGSIGDMNTGPLGKNPKWICMPIHTENAGPFTNVVSLLEQVIKECRENKKKYKNIGSSTDHIHIMLLCCNPGAISLPKSITGQKDVHIHYAKTSAMAENAKLADVSQNIVDGERYLQEFCDSIGIDYNDDKYLTECYNSISDDIDTLIEGALSKAWEVVKTIAKKIWAAIVAAFKWIWDLIKKIFNAIKSLFVKNKDSQVKDISYIKLEGAKVNKEESLTFGQAYQKILNSCDVISRKIKTLETTQTNIMKKIDQDLNGR